MSCCSPSKNPLNLRIRHGCRAGGLIKMLAFVANIGTRFLLIVILISAPPGLTAASEPFARKDEVALAQLVVRKVFLMGTEATLQMYSADRDTALRQLEVFIRIVEETEDELSTWQTSSELSKVNALALHVPAPVSDRMCRLLTTLRFWSRKTEGAFDPAVGTLVDVWDLRGQGRKPSPAEISRALSNSGIHRVNFAECVVERTADVKFDAGAFGKGVALRRILSKSKTIGAGPWLINFGGQVVISGLPPDHRGFQRRAR